MTLRHAFYDGEPWHELRLNRRRRCPLTEYQEARVCRFALTTAALVAGGLAAAGGIAQGVIGASAAHSAADAQTKAAEEIRQQALEAAKTASGKVNAATDTANSTILGGNTDLNAAKDQQLAALKPYIDAGVLSLKQVQDLLSEGGPLGGSGSFKFTPEDYKNDPGFAYIQQQANLDLQRRSAATGTALGGGTIRASARLNTGLASTHLDDAFNRALATYQTNRQNTLTRLQGLTGLVQTGFGATGLQNQDIGNTAQLVDANVNRTAQNTIGAGTYSGNADLEASRIAAQALASKGQAQAAGEIGGANAINSGIGAFTGGVGSGLIYSSSPFGGGGLPGPGYNPYPMTLPGTSLSNPLYTGYGSPNVTTGNTFGLPKTLNAVGDEAP